MSKTFFSKLDALEKTNRLSQVVQSKAVLTLWLKGQKERESIEAIDFNKNNLELIISKHLSKFHTGQELLCSFDLRGMTFFSQVTYQKETNGFSKITFSKDLFKSERRANYRLLAGGLYEVWADLDLGEKYQSSNVVNLNKRIGQTKLFKNFMKLAGELSDNAETNNTGHLKIRIQDLSTGGMSFNVGELELRHFSKDKVFNNVLLVFKEDVIEIAEAKVIYVINYIGSDPSIKKYKVGFNFTNVTETIESAIFQKINELLRENDFNKDFENFV
jgi:hypothetical protein